MIVPICLVFWSDQLRHSDPINIHVDYSHSAFCSEHIVRLSILSSIPSAYMVFHMYKLFSPPLRGTFYSFKR